MTVKLTVLVGVFVFVGASAGGAAGPPEPKTNSAPFNVGPVALTGNTYASAATVTANALGSGVNGPEKAQTGLTVNISKDNWWTGGKVGEIDGINVMMRQNAPGSDGSGILINVQNEGQRVPLGDRILLDHRRSGTQQDHLRNRRPGRGIEQEDGGLYWGRV